MGGGEEGEQRARGGAAVLMTPSFPLTLLCALSSLVTGCVASNATPSFWSPVYLLMVTRLSDMSKSSRGPRQSSGCGPHRPCSELLSVAGEK